LTSRENQSERYHERELNGLLVRERRGEKPPTHDKIQSSSVYALSLGVIAL
jgi:hypothetical protein